MKKIFIGLIALIAVFLFNPLSAEDSSKERKVAENLFKKMPAHEQKMIRVIASTKSMYLATTSYKGLNAIIIEKAYPNDSQSGREGVMTDIQAGDLVGVEMFASLENPKVAIFTLKSNDCPSGLKSMQNNFVSLNFIPNISNIECSPTGYVIKSYPKE